MKRAYIVCTGSSLGEKRIETEALLRNAGLEKLGVQADVILTELGVKSVYRSSIETKPSELAIEAAVKALQKFPGSPHDIGFLAFCGIERDSTEPATAHKIKKELGMPSALGHDISDACHGFTQGVRTARAMIESGAVKFAMVVTGERSSIRSDQITQMFKRGELSADNVRTTKGVFSLGDAGGALILGASEGEAGIIDMFTYTDSRWGDLRRFENFGHELGLRPAFGMNMERICAITMKAVREHGLPYVEKIGWGGGNFEWFIQHQVGAAPYLKTLELFDVSPDKCLPIYPECGNLASASMPFALDRMESSGIVKSGDRVLWLSSGSGIAFTLMPFIM